MSEARKDRPELFDVVELIVDLPEHGLRAGIRGTILDIYEGGEAYEVDFSDDEGKTITWLALRPAQFVLVWQAQTQEWIPLPERIAALVTRLPESVGAEVLDFARFLSTRVAQEHEPG